MKKIIKRSTVLLFCLMMIFNYSFSVLADENVESSEIETTYNETIETTEINETKESIEESESEEDETEEETMDESSGNIEEIENEEDESEEEIKVESSENIEEAESEEDEVEEETIDESSENMEELEEVDISSPSEIDDEENEEKESAISSEAEKLEEEETIDEATPSEIEEVCNGEMIDEATPSEIVETENKKCKITVYFITDMRLKDNGNGGSYNYSWDTFLINKNEEFSIEEKIPEEIKHSSCEQEYTLVGFTTENQIDTLWKGADYAGGVATLEKNFLVEDDEEIFAVYEAKDIYISSMTIDSEISYKTTTIPNKAIKNIIISNNNDNKYIKNENVKYYKIKNNLDDTNYMFTKDSSEGKPIKVEDFSLDKFK